MENGSNNKAQGTGNEGLNREAEMTETTFDTIADIDNLTAKELKGRYGRSFEKADGTSAHVDYYAGRGREKIGRGYSVTWFVADDTAEYGCRLIGPVCGDKFKSIDSVKVALREWMTGALENTQTVETVIPGDEVKLLGIKGAIRDTSRTSRGDRRIDFEAGGQIMTRILKPATKVVLFVRHDNNDKHGFERACQMDEQRMKDEAEDARVVAEMKKDDEQAVQTAEQKLRAKTTEHPKAHVGDQGLPEAKFSSAFLTIDSEYGQVEVQFGDALLKNKWSVILTGVDDWNTFAETFLDDDPQVMCSSSMDFPHEYSDDPKVWRLAYTLSGHSSDIDASVEWSRRQRLYIDNDTSTAADRDGYILHEGDTVRPDCPVPEIHGTVGKVLRMRTAPEADPFECDDDTPTEIIEVIWVDTGKVLEHGNVELVKVRPTADDPAPSTDCIPCPNCGEVVAPNMKRCPGCTRDNDAHKVPQTAPENVNVPGFVDAAYLRNYDVPAEEIRNPKPLPGMTEVVRSFQFAQMTVEIHETDRGRFMVRYSEGGWLLSSSGNQRRSFATIKAARTAAVKVEGITEEANRRRLESLKNNDASGDEGKLASETVANFPFVDPDADPKVPQFAGSTSRIVEAAERFGRQDIDEATVSAWPADACYLLAALIAEDATKASIIRDLQEDVRDLVAERDATRESFVEAHGKLDALDTKYTEVLLELDDTRNQSEAKSRTIGTLRDEVESLETEVGDLADEIIDLRKVSESDVEADTIEVLSEMVAEKDEEIDKLKAKLDSLRERYTEKSRTLRAVESHEAELELQVTTLQARIDKAVEVIKEERKCKATAREAALNMTKKACSKAAVLAERIAEHVAEASGLESEYGIQSDVIHLSALTDDPSDEETLRDLVQKYIGARS